MPNVHTGVCSGGPNAGQTASHYVMRWPILEAPEMSLREPRDPNAPVAIREIGAYVWSDVKGGWVWVPN